MEKAHEENLKILSVAAQKQGFKLEFETYVALNDYLDKNGDQATLDDDLVLWFTKK